MASYNELNALIDAYINRNGVQAITGQILNGVLKAMVEQLGRGYTIMGAAIPTTDPGTPDGPECYFASAPGTYTDFDGLQIVPGELALLCYTPSDGWTKETIYEGFQAVQATIDGNVGTPSVGVSYANGVLSFDFHNMKGNTGDPAGFGTIGAEIAGGVGTPGVTVESSGPATAKNLQFHFTNLKGETGVTSVVATVDNTTGTPTCTVSLVGQQLTLAFSGLKGAQGDTGVSADYPIAIVNNLTTNDPASALSAAQGVVLQGEITQLEAKVTGGTIVTRTGAHGFSDFTALDQATDVVISVEGDTTGLARIDFLENWSMKARVMGYTDWSNIKATLPAGCNKMGVYEVSGYTLNLNIVVKIDSITERINNVEGRVEDLETGLDKESKGVSIQDTLSVDERNFLSAIKKVGYYDPENTGVAYIRLFGFYSDHIQMTLTTDKSTMFDFKADAAARPTGEQTYRILNGSKELFLVFDWDKYSTNFSNTDYHLAIDNTDFSFIIAPAVDELQEQIDELKEGQEGTTEEIGFDGATNEQAVPDTVICPVKKVTKDGKIESIYLRSANAGKVTIYVGEVDQLYLFIARESYEINVTAGAQTIDVSDFDIYVFAGEQIAMKCNGNRFLVITDGTPEGEDSFYYGDTLTGLQLQAYTIGTKKIQFAFKATITESDTIALKASVERNTKAIEALNAEVGYVKSNLNVVSDLSGNKYRMKVVNGEVKAFALNFSHILAVGNSYTIHPTTTDTAPDLENNLWWGHWAMAASRKETSWPELLQTAIRQKNNSAKVTPVFGRRYETQLRSLSDNDAFLYWEDNQWKNLKPNVSAFSDVDCVLFFLGDNYTNGSGWHEIYKPMVLQFMAWFPNATIVCCSCRIREANNGAIAQVASEVSAVYVSMFGLGGASKLGNYVSGDDGNLHQIDNSAVAGHFGDYGEWMLLDRIVQAIGYENNATLYNIAMTNPTGVTLSVKDSRTIAGAIVSVFADISEGYSLTGISVTSGGNAVSVTDHGVTDYGRIFTFTMPSGDVVITGV